MVAFWLVAVNIFGFVAMNRFNLSPDTAYTWITPKSFPAEQSWDLVNMHNRWDTYWYLDIVKNGYYLKTDNTLSNVVFFPLYPFLIKIVGTILLGNYVLAGWIISMLALLGACAFFYKLAKEFHPEIDPEAPILLMLVFPTAFFFNVVYTEALFLFLTVATFYYVFKKNFYLAGALAFLGALTHSNGVFLALPILWEIWRIHGWKSIFTAKIFPVFFAPIGMLSFLLYDYVKFHDLFLFFKIESAWGRSFSINWDHFSLFSHPSIVNMGIDIFFTLFILAVIFLVYKKISALYAAFMSLTVLAALTSGTLMSIGRYSLVLFPVFILLASIKDKTFQQVWIFSSSLFLAMDIILWTNNYWAG
jgi:Gpi18-like mannosyltransferase